MTQKSNIKNRAVIYARVSKEDASKSLTINQQVADGENKAKQMGWTLIQQPLIDRNKSGKLPPKQWLPSNYRGTQYRLDFSRLITLIEKREIDIVIVRKLDRLNRSLTNQVRLIELMQKNKVVIATTHESLPTASDASGTLMMTIIAAIAQFELQKIVENVRATKEYAKKNDLKMMAGKNCAGYKDGENKDVLVNEDSRPAITKLFEMFSQGSTLKSIAECLNKHHPGSHSCLGKKWYHSSVHKVIQSPRYIGKKYDDNGELVPTKIYPAIINEDLWHKCQQRLKTHLQVYVRGKAKPNLFADVLKCGYCGMNMVAYSRYENGKKICREFKCLGKHRKGYHPSTLQEPVMLELINLLLLTAEPPSNREVNNNERSKLELQIEQLEQKESELADSYANGDIDLNLMKQAGNNVRVRLDRAKSKLDTLNSLRRTMYKPDQIIASLKTASGLSFEEKRSLLLSTIKWMKIYRDEIIVQRNPPDKATLRTIYYGNGKDKNLTTVPRGVNINDYRKQIEDMLQNPDPYFCYTFPIMLRQNRANPKSRPKHCFLPIDFECSTKEALLVFNYNLSINRQPDWSAIETKGVFWPKRRDKMPKVKLCTMCGIVKPMTDYIKVVKNADGRHGRCRLCDKTYRARRVCPAII
jgi:DNA invertase Pin-like site-specific DNA recombinase